MKPVDAVTKPSFDAQGRGRELFTERLRLELPGSATVASYPEDPKLWELWYNSFLWVVQTLYHQQYVLLLGRPRVKQPLIEPRHVK